MSMDARFFESLHSGRAAKIPGNEAREQARRLRFPGPQEPANVGILMYHYRFATPGERKETGNRWKRDYLDEFPPPVDLRRLE